MASNYLLCYYNSPPKISVRQDVEILAQMVASVFLSLRLSIIHIVEINML